MRFVLILSLSILVASSPARAQYRQVARIFAFYAVQGGKMVWANGLRRWQNFQMLNVEKQAAKAGKAVVKEVGKGAAVATGAGAGKAHAQTKPAPKLKAASNRDRTMERVLCLLEERRLGARGDVKRCPEIQQP